MSKQHTFDKVTTHLRQQNVQCVDDKGNCLYRGPNGLKCAVGALIPDNMYSPDFEGQACDWHRIACVLEQLGHDVELCTRLQRVHDWEYVEDWETVLAEVATEHGLTFTPRS